MASLTPLHGTDLIDCARANVAEGIEAAAQRCGYDDLTTFERELKKAADSMGIKFNEFTDLMVNSKDSNEGIIVAPETATEL
jgi:hypothetical protein